MVRWWAAVLASLALLALGAARRLEPKGAVVTLHTKWLGTPLVHEAAEFLVRLGGVEFLHPQSPVCCCAGLTRLLHTAAAAAATASCLRPLRPAQAEEGPALFWRFAEAWGTGANPDEAADDATCWERLTGAAGELLTPGLAKVGRTG